MPVPGDQAYDEQTAFDRALNELQIRRNAWGLALFQLVEFALTREVLVASPIAGAEWSAIVPPGSTWELLGMHFRFAASAVVANRFPTIIARDADNLELARFGTGTAVTASSTVAGGGYAGLGQNLGGGTFYYTLPTPPFALMPGWSLVTSTSGLDVGDQYSQVVLIVREWAPGRVARMLRYITDDLESAGGIL